MKWFKRSMPLWLLTLFSCGGESLSTVSELDLNRYMGTWYEIARFPHSFEKDLQCVSATYSLREDGKVTVYNRGYSTKKKVFKDITGKAFVPDPSKPGEIKVSFFGPFAGDYFVMDIDTSYSTVLVGSPSRNYLWLLARDTTMETQRYNALLAKATELGFDVSRLEKVAHNCE